MKKGELTEKTFALAELSEQTINRLWKLGLDVSKFVASVAFFFPSVFDALMKAVEDILQFGRRIGDFALTRVSLPPPGFWFRRAAPTAEEYLTPEMGATNIAFLFNVTVARRAAAELTKRAAAQTSQLTLPGIKTEEAVEGVPTDLQRLSKAALTPHVEGVASAFREYARRAALPALPLAPSKPPLVTPETGPPLTLPVTALAVAPIVRLGSEAARAARIAGELSGMALGFQVGFPTRPLTVAPQIPLPPAAEAEVKPALTYLPPLGMRLSPGLLPSLAMRMALPPVLPPTLQLKPGIAKLIEIATTLPSLALEPWIPILERVVAPLAAFPVPPSAALKPPLTVPEVGLPLTPPVTALAAMPIVQLEGEAARAVKIAGELPSMALEPWTLILKRIVAPFAISPAPPSVTLKSFLEAPVIRLPVIALAGKEELQPSLPRGPLVTIPPIQLQPEVVRPFAPRYAGPFLDYLRYAVSLRYPSQIDRVSEEILSSLTLWSRRVSWVLGVTTPFLPTVSIGALAAQRLAAQALAQPPPAPLFKELPGPISVVPISGFEAARTLAVQAGAVLAGLERFGTGADVWRIPASPLMLPPTVTPLVAQPSQAYPAVSVALEAITRLARAAPEKAPSLGETPGLKDLFREATFTLLAKSLVMRGLMWPQIGPSIGEIISSAFRYMPPGEMQTIRLSYGEALAELGGFMAMRETMISRLPPAGYEALRAVEPPMPLVPPSRPTPPTAPRFPGPTIQNTFNVTISADSEEELRNLERKIARILAEQIRRYYGSVRI